ncbi:MAG: 5'/3'-nucleotidase SurE [Phycisphaerae bacterium]|nr:5'/3'-nucleotidase SurE [Phycisphaerae bacterium]
MNILVCNDDGIFAPGLAALVGVAKQFGSVTVVAPESPQSAMAHSITLTRPLTVTQVKIPGADGFDGLAVDGRPADCVRLAIKNLVTEPIDLVLSGINAGANVGINVFYSGTVAAAAEATMMGIPAVAVSVAMDHTQEKLPDFAPAAKHTRDLLAVLLNSPLKPDDLININIPDLDKFTPQGVRVCDQSDAEVHDTYIRQNIQQKPQPTTTGQTAQYRLADDFTFNDPHHASDAALIEEGYITVTPLQTNITNHAKLKFLTRRLESGKSF